MKPMHRNRATAASTRRRVLMLACTGLVAALSGCSSMSSLWPWGGQQAAAPEPVHELLVTFPADIAVPVVLQFWERNTLVIDLQGVSTSGQFRLSRKEGNAWPARVAFRMTSMRYQQLEVRGEQRIVLVVAGEDGAPVTAELPPGIIGPDTVALTVSWGARGAF
jgi:hypothetical protein